VPARHLAPRVSTLLAITLTSGSQDQKSIMPTNIDDLELDDPPSVEPYEVLAVEKTATQDQIKTAYRKAALKWHPGEPTLPALNLLVH
jgi:DnaJ-domain-containing protein 1